MSRRSAKEVATQLPLELVLDIGEENDNRPEVIGDPLAPGASVSFPKPSSHVEIIDPDGGLKLEDRKLLNVLLAASWGPIGRGEPGPFMAPARTLRSRIGQDSENSNRRIRDSLDRLLSTKVRFLKRMADGQWGEAVTTLISYRAISPKNGLVEWDFHASLRPYLQRPCRWARLNLETCAKFHSKYSIVLYEHLSLRSGLDWPIWNVSIEEARAFFGVKAGRYGYFSQFYQSVVEPALSEVNAYAKFRAEVTVIDGSDGKPERLRFVILAKDEKEGPLLSLPEVAG